MAAGSGDMLPPPHPNHTTSPSLRHMDLASPAEVAPAALTCTSQACKLRKFSPLHTLSPQGRKVQGNNAEGVRSEVGDACRAAAQGGCVERQVQP
jgi:hypothetical protein